ncbi:MAG: DUF4080 domain-containing protein [Clostridia bacterium]|nr:DUF4080 domain-containing protein [Clostridia bacterium]
MKIALCALNGSYSHTNLAIRCLRPHLEAAGFDTVLVENSLKDRDSHVLRRLYEERADIYAFSTYIWNARQMQALAKRLKMLMPQAITIFGGPEVSFETERYDDCDFMDFILSGEGESTLPALCSALRDRGVASVRAEYGRVIGAGDLGTDNSHHVMGNEGILYRKTDKNAPLFYYESSRGCPYSCAYCLSSATSGVRAKSVEQTLCDLRAFEEFSGECKVVKFVDRTFNFDIARANRIWSALLSDEFTLTYHFEICVSLLNEESFEILSRFPKGKIQLEVGLQSTNPETLSAVSRHISADKVISATKRLRDMGNIDVYLDLIAGLPHEDMQSFKRSFDAAYFAPTRLQVGFLKLLPGTVLRRDSEKYGYVFCDEPPYTVLQSKWISYTELEQLHAVHEVMERYCESGGFDGTLDYVMPRVGSPFDFWNGFCSFLETAADGKVIQKISQPDAYRYMSAYLQSIAADREFDVDRAREYLRRDFECREHKRAPFGI